MCEHRQFYADVMVNRLEDSGKFSMDIKVHCTECMMAFQFLGLEPGLNFNGAAVSISGLEARLAIAPRDSIPTPVQRIVTGINKFDS